MAIETLKRLWKNEYFQTILTAALIFLVVLGIYYGAQAALGTPYPALAVASESMRPTLNIGDLIIVQKIDSAQINASKFYGDIVVFRNPYKPDDLIVHRAVEIQPAGNYYMITTAGDATGGSKDQFSPWNSSLLIGRVVARIPYIGNIPLLLRSESNMYIFLLIFIMLLIILMWPSGEKGRPTENAEKGRYFNVDLSHVFYIVSNIIIVGLLFVSLWGSYTIWQPGATPPRAIILGMYRDVQYHESFPGVKAHLSPGFLTYKIDCEMTGGTRLGVPTFAWYQFFIIVLILYNAWKIRDFWKNWKVRKKMETTPSSRTR